jgi:hypothetical protein
MLKARCYNPREARMNVLNSAADLIISIIKGTLLLISLGVLFNSARVMNSPEGRYDAEAKLSARIVFVIALIFTVYFSLGFILRAFRPG